MRTNQYTEVIIGELLQKKNLTIGCAESCTGGMLSNRITSVPGSSSYFIGSVVAYSDRVKTRLLGVHQNVLKEHGSVSKQAVEAMALGVRKVLKTDIGIAISGISGPSGGTLETPVGLVWIALAGENTVYSKKFLWNGNRRQNKDMSAQAALELLKEYLEGL